MVGIPQTRTYSPGHRTAYTLYTRRNGTAFIHALNTAHDLIRGGSYRSAAVVGVVINLAVFFAWHVLWPQGTPALPFAGKFEWFSALTGLAAALALFRYKIGIMPVIGACAAAGLGYTLIV